MLVLLLVAIVLKVLCNEALFLPQPHPVCIYKCLVSIFRRVVRNIYWVLKLTKVDFFLFPPLFLPSIFHPPFKLFRIWIFGSSSPRRAVGDQPIFSLCKIFLQHLGSLLLMENSVILHSLQPVSLLLNYKAVQNIT